MAWAYLLAAGLLEIVWAIGLKFSKGFREPVASSITLIALAASMWLLALAARELPIGTAYGVWVGIGALGTALAGIFWLGEPVSLLRVLCLAGLLASIVGLKLTSS
jgi:quaternary ammonium compound-resistance protein SugE